MSQGVEWALHTCLNLTWVTPGEAVKAVKLAAFYDLPPVYLTKQLQALVRAGLLESVPGPRGGFRLARDPASISLLDIVTAIEGRDPAFACAQILRAGPSGDADVDYVSSCVMSQAMAKADLAWRRELASTSLAEIGAIVQQRFPSTPGRTRERIQNVSA